MDDLPKKIAKHVTDLLEVGNVTQTLYAKKKKAIQIGRIKQS